MVDLSKVSVVLPSLDPDEKLVAVIDGLLEYGFTDIILVNDGSKPENLHYFQDAAAAHPEIHLLHHEVNKGKGAALKNAFRYFLENRPGFLGVVTVDGDNQHHPADTRACAEHMMANDKFVMGVRDFNQPHVPQRSRKGNHITSFVFKTFVGMRCSDTQTGLRAIPRKDLEILSKVRGERFEYETEMLLAMKRENIPFDEVKIRTVYIEENKSSHFRVVRDSWRIYKLILAHFFRYRLFGFLKFAASSLIAALVDEGIFMLLSHLLQAVLSGFLLTAVPTVCARAVSSFVNFLCNKKVVFQSSGKGGRELVRYYALVVIMLLGQMGLTHGLTLLLGLTPEQTLLKGLVYGVVMVALSVFSYTVQKRWVFAGDNNK